MAIRIPHIIGETLTRNPDYAPPLRDALARLRDAVAGDAALALFAPPAPDYDLWCTRYRRHEGETWLGTEWFFAEMLVYRLMIEAVHYWTTLRDPFAPFKQDEWASEALWRVLEATLHAGGSLDEQLATMLRASLWGNRIDLSLSQVAARGTQAHDDHLLDDGVPAAVEHLLANEPGTVYIIMDNAGTEQAVDCALTDLLLREHIARRVVLHVKMHPVLVSDVITADMHTMLYQMGERGGEAARLAQRLRTYSDTGQMQIIPDFFWNTDGRLWEMPPRLAQPFSNASLVLGKGDVNYRRATNDALWPPEARLRDALPDFPAPLLLLRTLKSDTLVGVEAATQSRLDADEPDWHTSGVYGVASFTVPAED